MSASEDLRRSHLGTVLAAVHAGGPLSRTALRTVTGLGAGTVATMSSALLDAGLLVEVPARGGTALQAGRDVTVLALELGVDHREAALVGLGGVVLARKGLPSARTDSPIDAVVAELAALGEAVLADLPPGAVCLGTGVSVPGVVRTADGVVRHAPNLGWVNEPLAERLARAIPAAGRVALGNDADLAALAEHRRGAAYGLRDVIYLVGEVGVGGGVIIDGRPLAGSGGYGGEIGHMVVNPRGRRCRCGGRGCWETEVGEQALLEAAAVDVPGRAGVRYVIAAAEAGDRRARGALRRVGRWLGVGTGNLVNVFNPQVVIFGGLFRELFLAVADQVRLSLGSVALGAPLEQVRLAMPGLGPDSVLHGAAELAFEPLLRDPLRIANLPS